MCGAFPYEFFPESAMMDNEVLPVCKMVYRVRQVGGASKLLPQPCEIILQQLDPLLVIL